MPKKTYQIGQRHKRSWRLIVGGVLLLMLAGGVFFLYQQFQQETKAVIKNTAGSTRPMEIPNSQTKRFDQGVFVFEAPSDWKLVKHQTSPYNLYSYQSTLKNADNRYLDIYMDSLPLNLAVNRAVDVRSQGANLSHGTVSENCTTFTSGSQQTAGQQGTSGRSLAVPAKWAGVEFICDNDNTTRNVIGTSAPGSVNKVILTGQTSGAHAFFLVYTDHNATPDYTLFYRILKSLLVT